jgi:hypothetical protein
MDVKAARSRIANLTTIRKFALDHPAFPENTLRDIRYHSKPRVSATGETIPPNGFADCFVKIPGQEKVLIDPDKFAEKVEEGRGAL